MTLAPRSVSAPWRRPGRPLPGLRRRELDVIAAAAEGLTTEEIATRLYISTSTVKTHLHSAQDRVGARNRVHLAVLAERAGLLG